MGRDKISEPIRYAGPPEITEAGRQVFSFHLYRYLSPWLREMGCERVMVTVGFADSQASLGAYRIEATGGYSVTTGWTHRDLEDAWRFGNGRLRWEGQEGAAIVFEVVAIFDENESDLLGFAMVRRSDELGPAAFERLAEYASEAIRVARRNSVRLFFDEEKEQPVKSLLYALMDRLPEWTGCDHSAAVLLTHNLDAMTMELAGGFFNVLAERIYFENQQGEKGDRLVGMAVETGAEKASILHDALERHRSQPGERFLVYERTKSKSESGEDWRFHGNDKALQGWHGLEDRPPEQGVVLIPLVHQERGESDLLGFLSLAWTMDCQLATSTEALIREVGRELAGVLRRSALYTMSVRKMWVIRKVGDEIENYITASEEGSREIEAAIQRISDLVAEHVDVPSFAIGYLIGEEGKRELRYAHPHGWSHFENLELAVDVDADERVDSGISALAIRLKRPVVLAGGHGTGADQEFKNFLWVDEEAGEIFDTRSGRTSAGEIEGQCIRLRDYYKPARETAYACLAYPILFADTALGVLTVEVEKTTDWLWWTGFGGHLFWEMVTREMARGLYWLQK